MIDFTKKNNVESPPKEERFVPHTYAPSKLRISVAASIVGKLKGTF